MSKGGDFIFGFRFDDAKAKCAVGVGEKILHNVCLIKFAVEFCQEYDREFETFTFVDT